MLIVTGEGHVDCVERLLMWGCGDVEMFCVAVDELLLLLLMMGCCC